jgi:two-component system, NarL family, response regulator LiaR
MEALTRVVIAEDHTLVREGTRRILESCPDIRVVGEAADGAEAVTVVALHRPDVVILDVVMPGMNGVEAAREIKTRFPEIAILVLTAHDEDQFVFALLEAGAAGYILKDVPGTRLLEAVHAVRAGESVLQPAVARKVLTRFLPGSQDAGRGTAEALTERELEVLRLAGGGLSNKEIASRLDVSTRTVQAHLAHTFVKLGVASRTEAVIRALREGWIHLDEMGEDGR